MRRVWQARGWAMMHMSLRERAKAFVFLPLCAWSANGLMTKRQISPNGHEETIESLRWPRRLLVFNWRDPWHPEAGGAEVMLHQHVKNWVRQGHEITLYTAHYADAPREEIRDGMRIVRRGGRFTVYLWAPVLYVLRYRRETDMVLDIENGIPFFTPLYSRKPRLCLVHHVHHDQFLSEFGQVLGRLGRFMECTLMPLIYRRTRFAAVSESTRQELIRIGIPSARCRVVHNGLDHSAYCRVVKRSASPRLLYVGRLKRHKRVDLLIDLCAKIRSSVPNVVLDIIGTGDDEPRLRALVAERGLEDAIRFHGFASHSRKVASYSYAWALMTTTQREGWGLSIIEAAACGTPTICLDAPGVRDAVEDSVSGLLAANVDALYDATVRFLTDGELRQHLSDGALRRASQFSWHTSAAHAREALSDAWLDRSRVPQRRTEGGAIQATLTLGSPLIPAGARDEAVQSIRVQLRAGDSVTEYGDEIQVKVAVSHDAELAAIEERLRRALAQQQAASVGIDPDQVELSLSNA
jgi:glycosyltransferase involved in cell wall biosynthesis